MATKPQILAVGGGKGGVGKTLVSLATSLALAELGKTVTLIDADLGGANLHSMLGVHTPGKSLYDFFRNKDMDFSSLVTPTPVPNLNLICGAPGTVGMANIQYWEKLKTIRLFRELDSDFVVVDLGAGTSMNEIDLFNAAHNGIVVAQPEPPAIQECYNFIKLSLFRRLHMEFMDSPWVLRLLDECGDPTHNRDHRLISILAEQVRAHDIRLGMRFYRLINNYTPHLILNQIQHKDEIMDGLSLQIAVQDLLRIKLEFWGYLPNDHEIYKSIRSSRPDAIISSNGAVRNNIIKIVKRFILHEDETRDKSEKNAFVPLLDFLTRQDKKEDDMDRICSVECPLWGKCEYQQGGLYCRMPENEYRAKIKLAASREQRDDRIRSHLGMRRN
ncbi:P-loop NTPase [candidate division KSB1 bacterium]|nr:P-loop NTPase [candidate division KSB1 bacterium]